MKFYLRSILFIFAVIISISLVSASYVDNSTSSDDTISNNHVNITGDTSTKYLKEDEFRKNNKVKNNLNFESKKKHDGKTLKKEDVTDEITSEDVSDNDDMVTLNNESLYEDYQDNEEVTLDKGSANKVSSSNRVSVSYSYTGVLSAANSTANYIDNNHHLPGIVVIDGKNVTMNDYLLITCKALNTTNNITINNTYSHCTSVTGTNYPGTSLNKTQYLTLAYNIIKCYDINGKNPYNIITENKYTMCFDDAVYYYSKILAYKSNNNKLPSSMKMVALYNLDYSSQSDALIVNSSKPFTITANYKSIGNNKYNFTLTSSETATIYYTRNGTTPTVNSLKYDGTLQIYNNTLIKYFGINKNNIKTPVLEFGIYEDSTPYISSKPALNKDKINYNITLSASQKSKIYYTLNGSRPTTKSTLYTKTISTLTNYTILQYISVTDKNKTSPIYYYHILNPTPYITIINNTEVRDNHQNVSILGNKPGQVYYTRNGTIPTSNSLVYEHRLTDLLITTQLQAILIDKDKKQSLVTTYQSPKIITPAVATVMPQTTLVNGIQVIRFASNKENTTLYYTTDGSNPYNSNTTKTVRIGKDMKVSSKVTLKYYTRDENQFRSAIYTYTPPQSSQERPTITIYNTTRIYSNNEQRIVIQSNQPGTIYHTRFKKNGTITYEYTKEMIIGKNERIQTYAIYNNTKYSKITEYNPVNGTKTVMNYTYTIKLPRSSRYIGINNMDYQLINTDYLTLSNVINYYRNNQSTQEEKFIPKNTQSVSLYTDYTYTIIEIHDIAYGDINQISMIYDTQGYGFEKLSVLVNNQLQYQIYITQNQQYTVTKKERITTQFKSNFISDSINKTEILNYGYETMLEYGFESIQTYALTNKLVTADDMTNWLNKNNTYTGYTKQTAYGTFLTGLVAIYFNDELSKYIALTFNTTFSRENDAQVLMGVDIEGSSYINIPDPTLSIEVLSGNTTNVINFRFMTTLMVSECERMAIQSSGQNVSSPFAQFYFDLLNDKSLNFTFDNGTQTIVITTVNSSDYMIVVNLTTGIVKTLQKDNLQEYLKGATSKTGEGYCYHNERTNNIHKNTVVEVKIVNQVDDKNDYLDELVDNIKDTFGGLGITAGVILIASGGTALPIIGGLAVVGGIALALNAAGANSLQDYGNPYYWVKASPTIVPSLIPGAGEYRAAVKGARLVKQASTLSKTDKFKYALTVNQNANGVDATTNIAEEWIIDRGFDGVTDTICDNLNLHPS